jgi:hypothetical protein
VSARRIGVLVGVLILAAGVAVFISRTRTATPKRTPIRWDRYAVSDGGRTVTVGFLDVTGHCTTQGAVSRWATDAVVEVDAYFIRVGTACTTEGVGFSGYPQRDDPPVRERVALSTLGCSRWSCASVHLDRSVSTGTLVVDGSAGKDAYPNIPPWP